MPRCADTRHEKFAQECANGIEQGRAYVLAGMGNPSPDKKNQNAAAASRLARRHDVRMRIAELKGAKRAYNLRAAQLRDAYAESGFANTEIAKQIAQLEAYDSLQAARASGDHKAANVALEHFMLASGLLVQSAKGQPGRPKSVKGTDQPPEGKPNGGTKERSPDVGDEVEISRVHSFLEELDGAAGDDSEAPADPADDCASDTVPLDGDGEH